ncbi:Coi1p KNAG_0C04730 [Huiozyma naganishii CBS 8797]|uniref:Uncharacterized protein n=1 Tax=Huiozyma naganishii (strain ATCC MYA-139 / BCRC 22969 / CBS 8797 / KCTC 17520 / NBRC 10181 / NCYC 3082 / Yp74L-3) TaxID=1071383 RepID=J7S4Z6_HUIN7|nr:hypothetical protein KNAG_0C04730 [Kazachstania naganishii CBS 8797]CCK69574.1 hypothetical protein KNAG_0C04730 [Kazachstania naganishii CBS 8797]
MDSLNPFKHVGKSILYVSVAGILSIYISKSIIRRRREAKFQPNAKMAADEHDRNNNTYYDNLAQVKPGFPLPKEDGSVPERKSKYEAGGISAVSRKRGDKLGFWDRRRDDD